MIAIFMMSFLRFFEKNGYGVIISVHDVTNKILSCDLNYNVNVVMWPKFGNSSVSVREVIITSISWGFEPFFEVWSWFKLNNLGMAVGTDLKFYTSAAKGLKLKVWKFLGLIRTFADVRKEKLVGGPFRPPILNRVKF